ncbi:hypothetical protein DRO26_03585 [Candidatus Bathyarchaeota archaeon]|nr:MAG: hypothetical protein DRO26_03585 [Candidatus Bathyarchaeota archaeon]
MCTKWRLPKRLFQGPVYEGVEGPVSEEADEEKISLRMQVFGMFPQKTVLDLFAGKGYLAWLYAKHGCEKIVCVEKDPKYFSILKQNMAEFGDRVVLILGDNLRFLDKKLDFEHPVTYVDFDAFGIPTPQIQKFFKNYPIKHGLIISITDSLIYNFRRMSNVNLRKHYLQDFCLEEDTGKPKSIQDLGEYCIQIQRNFMDILCMKYNAQAYPLYFKVNSRFTAVYSSYLILPKIIGVVDFKRYVGLKDFKLFSSGKLQKTHLIKQGFG